MFRLFLVEERTGYVDSTVQRFTPFEHADHGPDGWVAFNYRPLRQTASIQLNESTATLRNISLERRSLSQSRMDSRVHRAIRSSTLR